MGLWLTERLSVTDVTTPSVTRTVTIWLGERFPNRDPGIIEMALPEAHAMYSPPGLH